MITAPLIIRTILLGAVDVPPRVYINTADQDAAAPYVVLRTLWDEPEYIVEGATTAHNARVRVEAIAKSASAVDALSAAIAAALMAKVQTTVDVVDTAVPVTIWKLGVHMSDVGDDRIYHRVVTEYRVRYET